MIKVLSLYEILFGLVGLGTMILFAGPETVMQSTSPLFPILLGIFSTSVLFYALAVLAGILLWKMRKSGKILSIVIQALQTPIFAVTGLNYLVNLGLGVPLYLGSTGTGISFGLNFLLGPQFNLGYGNDGFLLGVNITAILLLILFTRIKLDETGL